MPIFVKKKPRRPAETLSEEGDDYSGEIKLHHNHTKHHGEEEAHHHCLHSCWLLNALSTDNSYIVALKSHEEDDDADIGVVAHWSSG